MNNNEERKEFLKSIVTDKNIPKDDLRKITCQTFIESNFVDSYFKLSLIEIVKLRSRNLSNFFRKNIKKQ